MHYKARILHPYLIRSENAKKIVIVCGIYIYDAIPLMTLFDMDVSPNCDTGIPAKAL